jgi:hypothetical protein
MTVLCRLHQMRMHYLLDIYLSCWVHQLRLLVPPWPLKPKVKLVPVTLNSNATTHREYWHPPRSIHLSLFSL